MVGVACWGAGLPRGQYSVYGPVRGFVVFVLVSGLGVVQLPQAITEVLRECTSTVVDQIHMLF